jgi:hypothetical protein
MPQWERGGDRRKLLIIKELGSKKIPDGYQRHARAIPETCQRDATEVQACRAEHYPLGA